MSVGRNYDQCKSETKNEPNKKEEQSLSPSAMTTTLMLEADKKITKKKSRSVFSDLDKALAGFAKIVDERRPNWL